MRSRFPEVNFEYSRHAGNSRSESWLDGVHICKYKVIFWTFCVLTYNKSQGTSIVHAIVHTCLVQFKVHYNDQEQHKQEIIREKIYAEFQQACDGALICSEKKN